MKNIADIRLQMIPEAAKSKSRTKNNSTRAPNLALDDNHGLVIINQDKVERCGGCSNYFDKRGLSAHQKHCQFYQRLVSASSCDHNSTFHESTTITQKSTCSSC